MTKKLLFLAHRIPYPPNKGDKIRSYNILKYLAKDYQIHLGAFIDDPHDWRYEKDVSQYCEDVRLVGLNPIIAKLKCTKGLLTGNALSIPYYSNSKMQEWVRQKLENEEIKTVFVFSSAMAQFVENYPVHKVIDFVDVDSDKWLQYARNKSWPANWIYQRESKRLLDYDRRIAGTFNRSLFVSEAEKGLFQSLAPETASRLEAVENGVDTDFFNGSLNFENPYPKDTKILVFTGAMDYWANVDAVKWYANEVFPGIRAQFPKVEFYIVGARPTEEVNALSRIDGIKVTGSVKEIRPYIKHAHIALAPLRIARGIQNKVLEAMSMGKVVMTSPAAMEGIESTEKLDALVVDSPEEWILSTLNILNDTKFDGVSITNRNFVERRYGWNGNLSKLAKLIEPA